MNLASTGADIEFNAEIGPGMFIAHPVGIVIGRGTVIGAEVTIFQGVTLAVRSWHPEEIRKFPRLGDHCFLFANSSVYGGVTVGNCCVISAYSVVMSDMPDGALARGVPAEIVSGKGRDMLAEWGLLDKVTGT